MSIQEYISLLEAFKLSLADNKSPEKIQVIERSEERRVGKECD